MCVCVCVCVCVCACACAHAQMSVQGCHWTFAKITENLPVRAVSQKMNTRRDKVQKEKDETGENRENGKRIGSERIGPKITEKTENRHPCVCVCAMSMYVHASVSVFACPQELHNPKTPIKTADKRTRPQINSKAKERLSSRWCAEELSQQTSHVNYCSRVHETTNNFPSLADPRILSTPCCYHYSPPPPPLLKLAPGSCTSAYRNSFISHSVRQIRHCDSQRRGYH